MPDCNETLREIYEYLDGELTNDEKAKLRHHLEECQPCFEAFDFEAELREVIRKRCTESVPESLSCSPTSRASRTRRSPRSSTSRSAR